MHTHKHIFDVEISHTPLNNADYERNKACKRLTNYGILKMVPNYRPIHTKRIRKVLLTQQPI